MQSAKELRIFPRVTSFNHPSIAMTLVHRNLLCLTVAAFLCSCAATERTEHGDRFGFGVFLDKYNSANTPAEQQELAAAFWADAVERGMPLFHPNGTEVVFLHKDDDAKTVELIGDMTGWDKRLPFTRLHGTRLHYLRASYPPDARLDYMFMIDGQRSILDPGNARAVQGGHGVKSELAMPGFVQAPELDERKETVRGTLATIERRSEASGYDHLLLVYLPPHYDQSRDPYPVAYFQDGNDYIFLGKAPAILDNLIADGAIQPIIAVFVVPPSLPHKNRVTEYSMNDGYARSFVTEIVPFIDSTYRTIPKPHQRLVIGDSRGGLISLYIAFRHPEVFANAASQSGYVSYENNRIISLFRGTQKKNLRLYADVGLYEETVHLSSGGADNFLKGNRLLRDVLVEKGYAFEYREFPDGHSWGRWRTSLPDILRVFFGLKK